MYIVHSSNGIQKGISLKEDYLKHSANSIAFMVENTFLGKGFILCAPFIIEDFVKETIFVVEPLNMPNDQNKFYTICTHSHNKKY